MAIFFISYRRSDTGQIAGRIYEELTSYFGSDSVYLDIENFPIGTNFRDKAKEAASTSDAILILIGPHWLEGFRERENQGVEDYVKIEIEEAILKNVPILPLLIGATPMPDKDSLPESISQVFYQNALSIDTVRRFKPNMIQLIDLLEEIRISKVLSEKSALSQRVIPLACEYLLSSLEHELHILKPELQENLVFLLEGDENKITFYGNHINKDRHELTTSERLGIFLYRIVQDSTSILELHFLATPFFSDAILQFLCVGWLTSYLHRIPILVLPEQTEPDFGFRPRGDDRAEIDQYTLRLFPNSADPREVWGSITTNPYILSVAFTLRITL